MDLNRDFPDRLRSESMVPTGREQPETMALINWLKYTKFVASAGMHEVGEDDRRCRSTLPAMHARRDPADRCAALRSAGRHRGQLSVGWDGRSQHEVRGLP